VTALHTGPTAGNRPVRSSPPRPTHPRQERRANGATSIPHHPPCPKERPGRLCAPINRNRPLTCELTQPRPFGRRQSSRDPPRPTPPSVPFRRNRDYARPTSAAPGFRHRDWSSWTGRADWLRRRPVTFSSGNGICPSRTCSQWLEPRATWASKRRACPDTGRHETECTRGCPNVDERAGLSPCGHWPAPPSRDFSPTPGPCPRGAAAAAAKHGRSRGAMTVDRESTTRTVARRVSKFLERPEHGRPPPRAGQCRPTDAPIRPFCCWPPAVPGRAGSAANSRPDSGRPSPRDVRRVVCEITRARVTSGRGHVRWRLFRFTGVRSSRRKGVRQPLTSYFVKRPPAGRYAVRVRLTTAPNTAYRAPPNPISRTLAAPTGRPALGLVSSAGPTRSGSEPHGPARRRATAFPLPCRFGFGTPPWPPSGLRPGDRLRTGLPTAVSAGFPARHGRMLPVGPRNAPKPSDTSGAPHILRSPSG